VLTKVWVRALRRCRDADVDGERRRTDRVGEDAAVGVLRASGLRGSTWDDPAEVLRGSGGPEMGRR
jgi:hypothetical protein